MGSTFQKPGTDDVAHWLMRERRPGNRRLLYLSTLFVLGAIAAFVLLANGQRNLHRLLGTATARTAVPTPPLPVARLAAAKPVPTPTRHFPPRYFSSADMAAFSTFIRLSSVPASRLCRFLAEAGLRNDGWRASELDPRSHECPSALRLFSAAPGGGFDTAYADVKSDDAGQILRLRIKVSARDPANRVILDGKVAAILDFVVAQSGWPDLSRLSEKVLASGDFVTQSHGLRVSRSQERLAPERYNLTMSPIFETLAARNAYGYFLATDRRLPAAPDNRTTPEQRHRALRGEADADGPVRVLARFFPPPGRIGGLVHLHML